MSRTVKDAYFNVGPPRPSYTIECKAEAISGYEYFSLRHLCETQFGLADNHDMLRVMKEYLAEHKAEIDSYPAPKSFMIGKQLTQCGKLDQLRLTNNSRICTDLVRAIAILGRVSGNIYIPQRSVTVTEEILEYTLAFLISEIQL